ncbi:MAG: FAD-dependent monooxygenase [Gemmatimonadaceae bacterium]|nr:FAD-dependent monooxygenase [Gemmatimonadaceae bacterium]
MATHDAEVIVVGGGPAGAASAWFLARAGIDVLVVDRARFPRDKPCAEYLSPQASRILNEMGVLGAIEAAGAAQLSGMRVRAPNGVVIHGEFVSSHGFRGFRDCGLALPRRQLDALLLDRARHAGARVLEQSVVRDLARSGTGRVEGIDIETHAGRRTLRAPLVVGADGLRTVVGRRLGLTRTGRFPRRVAVVAHYGGVDGMGRCGEMHVDASGYLGLADVGHGMTNVAVVVPAAAARAMGGAPGDFLDQWIAGRPHLARRFAHARRLTTARATGPFNTRARRAWTPGCALVGDAAEFFDPFTGEGIYAALHGGELLTQYAFEAARAPTTRRHDIALAAYDRCLRHAFRGKRLVERIVGTAVAFPSLLDRTARVLAHRRDMADLLVGVTGDFVPPGEVLRPGFIVRLLAALAHPGAGVRGSETTPGEPVPGRLTNS